MRLASGRLSSVLALVLISSCSNQDLRGSCQVAASGANLVVPETNIPALHFSIQGEALNLEMAVSGQADGTETATVKIYNGNPWSDPVTIKDLKVKAAELQTPVHLEDVSGETLELQGTLTHITTEVPLKSLTAVWPDLEKGIPRTGGIALHLGGKVYQREFLRVDSNSFVSILQSLLETLNEKPNGQYSNINYRLRPVATAFDFEKRTDSHKSAPPLKLPIVMFTATTPVDLKKTKEVFDKIWKDQCGIEIEFQDVLHWEAGKNDSAAFTPVLMSLNELRPEMTALLKGLSKHANTTRALSVISGLQIYNPQWESEMKATERTTEKPKVFLRGFTSRFSDCSFQHLAPVFRAVQGKTAVFVESVQEVGILAHEVGHALGFHDHSDDSENLMHSVVTKNIKLTADQCETARRTLQREYGNQ